jgi:hypothetical protein
MVSFDGVHVLRLGGATFHAADVRHYVRRLADESSDRP